MCLHIEVKGRVATAYRGDVPVAAWEASIHDYAAPGQPWVCSCGQANCEHQRVLYWGEAWSAERIRATNSLQRI